MDEFIGLSASLLGVLTSVIAVFFGYFAKRNLTSRSEYDALQSQIELHKKILSEQIDEIERSREELISLLEDIAPDTSADMSISFITVENQIKKLDTTLNSLSVNIKHRKSTLRELASTEEERKSDSK